MSKLSDFLCENLVDDVTEEVTISARIPFKFKIRAVSSTEFNSYRKKATKVNLKTKQAEFDPAILTQQIVINHTVEPNFRDAECIKKVGCVTPEQYLNKVLLAGEVEELNQAIQKLSGFDLDINEAVEEAKN